MPSLPSIPLHQLHSSGNIQHTFQGSKDVRREGPLALLKEIGIHIQNGASLATAKYILSTSGFPCALHFAELNLCMCSSCQAPCKYFMLPPSPLQALVGMTEVARLDLGLLHQLSVSRRGTVHSAASMSTELPAGTKPTFVPELLPQFPPLRKWG